MGVEEQKETRKEMDRDRQTEIESWRYGVEGQRGMGEEMDRDRQTETE